MYQLWVRTSEDEPMCCVRLCGHRRDAVADARAYMAALPPGANGRVEIVQVGCPNTVVWWWQEYPFGAHGGQIMPDGRRASVRRSPKKGGKNVEQL
ncbi:MAG: hypothetical protein KatS3mg051_1831 [Anaerolineae bacterium]|nr:MAG: hypothetical protein KatS3mg051_1831 [Anaerolineae bacterium]